MVDEGQPPATAGSDGGDGDAVGAIIAPLCALVLSRTGNDFSAYKRSSVRRRIERRMAALELTAPAYLAYAEAHPAEPRALLGELLISVTQFFRDAETLDHLARETLPSLPRRNTLRAWVPGCATGEEAYTLAMLLLELVDTGGPPVVVFATDIDLGALDQARAGHYPLSIANDVSAERLARFFVREGDGYRVSRRLRDACVFSHHNLLHDPAFSHLALLSCRNLLIYLEAEEQGRLFPAFHYALDPGGVLLLGSAESADRGGELFEAIDRQRRIYRRAGAAPGVPPWNHGRLAEAVAVPAPRLSPPITSSVRAIERMFLERYVPPSVVVNERDQVIYVAGSPGAYLELAYGAMPFDLLAMVKPALRHELRQALAQARETGEEAVSSDATWTTPQGPHTARVLARPLPELGAGLFLVTFQQVAVTPGTIDDAPTANLQGTLAELLDRELRAVREQWRLTDQALEASNEDLRASNEEYQVLNEELHTSREELQSINEELHSVNAELRMKIDALDAAHGDLQNLFDASDLGTILLDRSGAVRRFSPAAAALFPLRGNDVGRPLADITCRASTLRLAPVIEQVLDHKQPSTMPVQRDDDARFLMRVVPYRTLAGAIDGVVITFLDVTDVERAERKARDHAAELAQVLEAVPTAVFITHDDQARAVTGNAMARTLLRLPADAPLPSAVGFETNHRGFRVLRDGVELTTADLAIVRAVRGEATRNFELDLEFEDGEVRHMLGNAGPLRNDDGAVVGGVTTLIDVTERRAAALALTDSEARYRTLAAAAVDLITRFDRELRCLYANPAALQEMARAFEEVVGTHALALGDTVGWHARLAEVFARGEPLRFEWPGPGGRWFDVQLSPEHEDERVVTVVSVARDITQKRRVQHELRASEERYRAMFTTAPYGIAVAERATGTLLAVNPAFEAIVATPAAALLGKHVAEAGLVTADERLALGELLRRQGTIRAHPVTLRRPDGTARSVSSNVDTAELDGAAIIISSVEDVTDRLAAEAERARLQDELTHAQKMQAIGTLAGGVAHDFNNILAGLLGGLSLVAGALDDRERALADLAEMQALAMRGASLTKQLLGFARGGKYDIRALDLAQVVTATAEIFRHTRRDVVVSLELPAGLAPVLMDHAQLEQVLLNLLVNAGHAMPDGGQVTLRAHDAPAEGDVPARVVLEVIDTGVGMTPEVQARIFEPFFTTKASGEGTGLGLASVYGIITHHGGTIAVTSAPGKGTTFTLRLPVAQAAAVPAPVAPTVPPTTTDLASRTILVVDDEPHMLRLYARLLGAAACRVLSASDGLAAIEVVREHHATIDLVVLDLTMPGLSGPATFDALRALAPTLKVLLASGHGPEGQARDLLARSNVGFLQKPFTVPVFMAALQAALAMSEPTT